MTIAILGPGGVGGLLAAALHRSGQPLLVIAREPTARVIRRDGIRLQSLALGDFTAMVPVLSELREPVDTLIVATKALELPGALERISSRPGLILPLLNGLDHLALLRDVFAPDRVLAASIRVESDRSEPGLIRHTSPITRVEMASAHPAALAPMRELARVMTDAGISAAVREPVGQAAEAWVMWSKLARLNTLACLTSAYDLSIGPIREDRELRAELIACAAETCAVARAEGAPIEVDQPIRELDQAPPALSSSMQRDIAAGRTPELDAIAGAVLRAARRHGLESPVVARLAGLVARRAGLPDPAHALS